MPQRHTDTRTTRLVLLDEGSRILGISKAAFTRLVDDGEIPFVRYGNSVRRYDESWLLEYREKSTQTASAS